MSPNPCVRTKPISSSSVFSFSLFYVVSLRLQNHLSDTFNMYLWSIDGWLCGLCYTSRFFSSFSPFIALESFFTPHLTPVRLESLFLYFRKFCGLVWKRLSSWRGCLQKDHVPQTLSKSQVGLSVFLSSSLSFRFSVFLSDPEVLSMGENNNVIWKISPQDHRSPSNPFFSYNTWLVKHHVHS